MHLVLVELMVEMGIKIILTEQLITMLVVAVVQVGYLVNPLVVEMVEMVEVVVLLIKELDLQVQVHQEEAMVEMVLKELVKQEVQVVLILVEEEAELLTRVEQVAQVDQV